MTRRHVIIVALITLISACATPTKPTPAPTPAASPKPSPYVNPGWDNPPP